MVRVHAGTVGNARNVVRTSQRVDSARFGNAPAPGDVGLDDVAALALEQLPEPVARVLVLARRDQQARAAHLQG